MVFILWSGLSAWWFRANFGCFINLLSLDRLLVLKESTQKDTSFRVHNKFLFGKMKLNSEIRPLMEWNISQIFLSLKWVLWVLALKLLYYIWEHSGSVVECLTWDQRAAGSSLTGFAVLCPWARHINPNLTQPRKTHPNIIENFSTET